MFLTASEGPVASNGGLALNSGTLRYIFDLDTAVRDLWSSHAEEIKQRCAASMPTGMIDQQEVFGFALADGLARPLIPHDRARKVGQAGDDAMKNALGTRQKPGRLRRAREAKREAVRKATDAAAKDASLCNRVADAERDGEKLVNDLLNQSPNLQIPNETVGAKRKCCAVAVTAGPPSIAELQAAYDEAKQELEAADQKVPACEKSKERAKQRLEELQNDFTFDAFLDAAWAETDQNVDHYSDFYDATKARWSKTPLGRAERAYHEADHAVVDAICDRMTALEKLQPARSNLLEAELARWRQRRAKLQRECPEAFNDSSDGSEDSDNEPEEDQLTRLQHENAELRAENQRLRTALLRATMAPRGGWPQ